MIRTSYRAILTVYYRFDFDREWFSVNFGEQGSWPFFGVAGFSVFVALFFGVGGRGVLAVQKMGICRGQY